MEKWEYGHKSIDGNHIAAVHYLNRHHPEWDVVNMRTEVSGIETWTYVVYREVVKVDAMDTQKDGFMSNDNMWRENIVILAQKLFGGNRCIGVELPGEAFFCEDLESFLGVINNRNGASLKITPYRSRR